MFSLLATGGVCIMQVGTSSVYVVSLRNQMHLRFYLRWALIASMCSLYVAVNAWRPSPRATK
jgi:hypothetical protein